MPRSKSNEFNKEVDKTSALLGEAFVNAIRLAVRVEIREVLITRRVQLRRSPAAYRRNL
jgi:hypothetical protein